MILKVSGNIFFFLIAGLIVYSPVLNTTFFSDDFVVLNRLMQRVFSQGLFFRPLSDFSIFIDYLLFGTNSACYHVVNVLIHSTAAFFVYRLMMAIIPFLNIPFDRTHSFSLITSLFFLVYPFHSEPVVWIVGRGVILAGCLSIISFWLYVKSDSVHNRFLSSLFYFVALFGYESVIILPVIVFVAERLKIGARVNAGMLFKKLSFYAVAGIIYLAVRYYFLKDLIGEAYYFRINASFQNIILNFFRLTERSILPPIANAYFAMILVSSLILLLLIILYIKKSTVHKYRNLMLLNILAFLLSLAPLVTVGINTHTSEGERFLYFPSVFFVALIASLLFVLVRSLLTQRIIFGIISCYFLYFLFNNQLNWRKSSTLITAITDNLNDYSTKGNLFIIDMPDDVNGAYVFRNGFWHSFRVLGYPEPVRERVKILSFKDPGDPLSPFGKRFGTSRSQVTNSWILFDKQTLATYVISSEDKIFYFNDKQLQQIIL